MTPRHILALLLLWPSLALAQTPAGPAPEGPTPPTTTAPPTPPHAGGPQPNAAALPSRDAGPASHPPRTDGPQAVNRGTDGSAAGLTAPGATGTTPQGMEGSATAGARNPNAPVGTPPPRSAAP